MNKEGLISVIIAVYNINEYIARCVESVMAQTYGNLEIILVDDGSTDGSGQICDDYARRDQRIKVVHKQNGGLSDARNAGVAASTGAYIGYVDGDDYIDPEMYEALITALTAQQAQVAVCRFRQMGEGAENQDTTGETAVFSREEALEIYICGHPRYQIFPCVWSKLFAREVVQGIQFAVGKSSEDIMYTTEVFSRIERCAYLDIPYYNYIVDRQGSIMNQKIGERRFACEIPIWREQADFLKEQGMEELAKKSRYYFYRKMLFYYIDFREAGQKEFARRLSALLRREKAEIKAVYANDWTAFGDRVRMRVMLASPGFYYRIVKLYDKYLIPLRQAKQKGQ